MRARVAAAVGMALLLAVPCARAETVQSNGIRIEFAGALSPTARPRATPVPARLSFDARIAGADGSPLPRLSRLAIGLSRAARIETAGLPVCHLAQIQPATTEAALAACGPARVGGGRFGARVQLTEQAPYPSQGRIVAFNGRYRGAPAILLHVFGSTPVPTSYTLPLTISRGAGEFGTVLATSLAQTTPTSGRVTRLSLTLGRTFTLGGRPHAYLTAVCPAPPRLGSTVFPLLRTRLGFAGRDLDFTVNRGCGVGDERR